MMYERAATTALGVKMVGNLISRDDIVEIAPPAIVICFKKAGRTLIAITRLHAAFIIQLLPISTNLVGSAPPSVIRDTVLPR